MAVDFCGFASLREIAFPADTKSSQLAHKTVIRLNNPLVA
jgi:hypothetical protein